MQITLKAARTNTGLTQRVAAKKLGVALKTLGNWERGDSFPDAIQIRSLERLYGVKYDDLIFLPRKTL